MIWPADPDQITILIKEDLSFGFFPMVLGPYLIGRSPFKIPKPGFGGGTMVGDLMIAIIGRVEIRATNHTFDVRMDCSV
jgi:hypothetical protein